MADRITGTKKIFVETEYDNIIVVNPNEVYGSDGKTPVPRLVDHEDLVFYANLETFIIPRTKLAIGDNFDNLDSLVFNTTIATVFGGDDDLKINFLKPKGGKTAFDTSWSDQITGENSRSQKGSNQKTEQVVSQDGVAKFKNSVTNYEDTQLLGIKSVRVNIKGTGVPDVTIEMVDIQGRSLFEQGENSLYSAFFNFPYPLFYLTLKGYYGKAIRYRLALTSFNSSFDAENGNFNITLKLIGKFTALLFDTPLQYAITSPKMYNSQITVKDPVSGNNQILNTYKGRQKLHEVYKIYKRKGLIDDNFDEISIEEFIARNENFTKKTLDELINDKKGDFTQLNDIIDFRENLTKLRKEVYDKSLSDFIDRSSYYVVSENGVNQIYYPYKKEISDQTKEDYRTKLNERITQYVLNLKNNSTFGQDKSSSNKVINVIIKNENDIIKKLDFNSWVNNDTNVKNTFFFRTGKQYEPNNVDIVSDYEKFVIDETKNANLTQIVKDATGQDVDTTPDYFVFGDKLINDGIFIPKSYLFSLDQMEKSLNTKEEEIEKSLGSLLSAAQTSNLGFNPTIRNIFAIIFAGADAFYRLMDDTHQEAWNVRNDPQRLLSVIPPEKQFSPDAIKSIQRSSNELNKDNVIYPWPLYFTQEKQKDGRLIYVIQYPGDSKIINQTRANDYRIWPEIGFVEAYLKGVVEKDKPTEDYIYDNPSDLTKYVSANALEFPFKTIPYQDLDAIKTFYEIFERTYIASHYGKLDINVIESKQIDKFYGDIESKNLSLVVPEDISLNKLMKDLKLQLPTLIEYMKKISDNGNGDSFQTYLRGLFKTVYLENIIKSQDEIYSIDTLNSRSIEVSADQPLVKNLTDYLNDTSSSKLNPLDTYPFTNINWLKNNMSDSANISNFENFNDTTKTFVYLENKKTISRINETKTYTNIKLFNNYESLKNGNQLYITDQSNDTEVTTRQSLENFFKNRKEKNYYVTESLIDYGSSYSGQVKTKDQKTSFLNTPYFINSILKGVEEKKNKNLQAFVPLGYLYLNSLPLITTKERLINIDTSNVKTDLDYLSQTLNKYSAIHQVPYAWVLKYGSIWHRYKKFIEQGVDILNDVWKDFDYKKSYDPITSSETTPYTIPDYTGGTQTIRLQNTELFPIPLAQSKDFLSVGFYPSVINAVNNLVLDEDLFTGFTTSDFLSAYTKNQLRIGINTLSTNNLPFGFDSSNVNRQLFKQNLYQYREFTSSTATNPANVSILLFPSFGGIPIDQSIFECVDSNNNLKTEILNNKSIYNGSVRSLWGSSHFGYFDHSLIKKPSPLEYIKSYTGLKDSFNLMSTQTSYSNIEEIFSLFTVEMLNKFEEKFLGFCSYEQIAKDITLTDEIIDSEYNQQGGLYNVEEKSLISQMKSIFVLGKSGIENFGINQNDDGKTLGKKQINAFTESINKFLNFDCVIKLGNPGHFDRKLFNSFSNLTDFVPTDKYNFLPYIKGTLPGDGTSQTLLLSISQNRPAWDTLRLYLGFSSIPNVDYPTQVQTTFPSTPSVLNLNIQPQIELKFVGNSSSILPNLFNTTNSNYINIVIPTGGFSTYKIDGVSNFNSNNILGFKFYQPNSDINDINNQPISSNVKPPGLLTNFTTIIEVNGNTSGNYIMVVDYKVSPTLTKTLVSNISTNGGVSTTIPTFLTPPSNVLPLVNTQTSLVSDFFINNNIKFSSENIKILYPLIRLYVENKLKDDSFNKSKFTTFINDLLTSNKKFQGNIVNQTFSNLNKILPDITITNTIQPVTVTGDNTKLSLYNTLKGFNDKWISGSDLKSVTLFEDFLFMDRANSDVGDTYVLDVDKVIKRLDVEKSPDKTMMQLVSNILTDNDFMFMAMPAYINFYGIQQAIKNGQPIQDVDVGNSLFGTYLEVDYTKSSPKFLCLYMGKSSEYPKPKDNSFNRFGDDSFDLRIPTDNPLNISDTKRDYSKTNRVVGFSVDFGIRNQNIFKSLDLDMSEMQNTSESFKVFADLGSSVSGDKVGQQSTSMYGIYKSRSYSCGVKSMGNVMIQPTMYFILRHVPMFYGPYWIYEVNHNVSERGFDTDFKGSRIPKYSLPNVNNLLINVNKNVLKSYKEKIRKQIPESLVTVQSDDEIKLSTDITITKTSEANCLQKTQYPKIPFVNITSKTYTINEVTTIIKSVTSSTSIRSLLLGIAKTRLLNLYNGGTQNFNSTNNNLYEITTQNILPGNLEVFVKEQSCVRIGQYDVPIVKFENIKEASEYMVSYYTGYDQFIENLKSINPNSDISVSYGDALAQLAACTWDTAEAILNNLNAEGIKDYTIDEIFKDNKSTYDFYSKKFEDSYRYFLNNPN